MTPDEIQDGLESRGLLELAGDVALSHHVTLDETTGRRRTAQIVRARHATWRAIRDLGFSYPEIGSLWGVDQASVRHGVLKPPPR